MTQAADKFARIAERLREIKGRAASEPEVCPRCDGGGWVLSSNQAVAAPCFDECPECGNPHGRPAP